MKLGIIIGSTRQGRVTDRVGTWVAAEAAKLPDTKVAVLDLRDYPLPFFDEAISPQYNPERTVDGVVKRWLDTLQELDAFVVVTPEYNRSIPAVLKNALDYVAYELAKKPVAIVAHGSNNGAQSVSALRSIIPGALAISIPAVTYIAHAGHAFDEQGTLAPEVAANPYGPAAAITKTLEELKWFSDALAEGRK